MLITSVSQSNDKLGLDYVNLYLIHQPRFISDIRATWNALEESQVQGLTISIGVSNFTVNDFLKIEGSKVLPVVNQVSHEARVDLILRAPLMISRLDPTSSL